MFSFRPILLAAAAFATITSAILAAPPAGEALKIVTVPGGAVLGGVAGAAGAAGKLLGGVLGSEITRPRRAVHADLPTKPGITSASDIFKTCSDGVELIVVKIGQYRTSSIIMLIFGLNDITDAAVNVEGGAKNVDHGLVIVLLEEILVLLKAALKDLKVVVVDELTLNGVACTGTLKELARFVAGLVIVRVFYIFWAITQCPNLVSLLSKWFVSSCQLSISLMSPSTASLPPLGMLFLSTLHTCYSSILLSVLLCELLEAAFVLVADLRVEVAVLIQPFVEQCNFAHYGQILAILGILV